MVISSSEHKIYYGLLSVIGVGSLSDLFGEYQLDIPLRFLHTNIANNFNEYSIRNRGGFFMKQEHVELDCCEGVEVHQELLDIVNEKLPPEEILYDLAELFKIFGDSTRIRILFVLFESEVCVCDLAAALNMTQSAVSHQLRILKQNKLVHSRREGKSVFYSLADAHVRTIINQGLEHVEED